MLTIPGQTASTLLQHAFDFVERFQHAFKLNQHRFNLDSTRLKGGGGGGGGERFQHRCWMLMHMLKKHLGCVRLGNPDLDLKIWISDFQSNTKSENGFRDGFC